MDGFRIDEDALTTKDYRLDPEALALDDDDLKPECIVVVYEIMPYEGVPEQRRSYTVLSVPLVTSKGKIIVFWDIVDEYFVVKKTIRMGLEPDNPDNGLNKMMASHTFLLSEENAKKRGYKP